MGHRSAGSRPFRRAAGQRNGVNQRKPLPPQIDGRAFSVASALAAGANRNRLTAQDLQKPFHGIRLPSETDLDLVTLCAALATTFRPGDAFTGPTAARLWKMPLPRRLEGGPLHVSTLLPLQRIRRAGVLGTRRSRGTLAWVGQLPVMSPADTWVSLAALLSAADLTAVGDFLVTGDRGRHPLMTIDELAQTAVTSSGVTGAPRLRQAKVDVRQGSWSRPETHFRLLCMSAGLPEPALNVTLLDANGRKLIPDLAWPDYLVASEYNGQHHEQSRNRIADVQRLDRYADIGWSAMAVNRTELYGAASALVARTMRRLVSRGWTGGHTVRWPLSLSLEP